MDKLKTFFYVFRKSISSPEYYKELLETKFAYTVKYYIFLSLILSLIISCVVSIKAIPSSRVGLRIVSEEIKKIYPDDLIINVKDGKWNINKPEPYIIPLPNIPENTLPESDIKNIIVFYKQGTVEDLDNFKTFSLVNETNVLAKDKYSGMRVYPIKDFPNFDIDKSKVNEVIDRMYEYLKYIPFFLPLIIFLGQILFNFLGTKVIYILWIGLVLFLFSFIRKNKLSYLSACRIGIHTMTLPLLFEVILSLAKVNVPIFGWFFLVNVILSLYVLEKIYKKEETLNPKI